MKSLLQSNKRAVSNIVAYVLLISITIALSVLVHNWLRNYVADDSVSECPSGVSIKIKKYLCQNEDNIMLLELENNGRYSFVDLSVKINNISNSDIGIYDASGDLFEIEKDDNLIFSLNFDSEYNMSNIKNFGSTWVKNGKVGGARNFDGVDDYISIISNLEIAPNSPFSFSAWIKWSGQTNPESGIFGSTGGNIKNSHFELTPSGTRIRLGDVEKTGMTLPEIDKWSFVAFVYENGITKYYINGEEKDSFSGFSGEIFTGDIHTIGRSDSGRPFNGLIDEVKIFNRALTQGEVQNLYHYYHANFNRIEELIQMLPSESKFIAFDYSKYNQVTLLELQPIVADGNSLAYCKTVTQKTQQCN